MTIRIHTGDCRARLAELPAESVQCVVTSPPYFGLRDYGTAQWDGGDPECEHEPGRWDGPKQTQGAMSGHAARADRLDRTACKCGAVRIDSQIGLEPTLSGYIATLVDVFRALRRVLRPDGTVWLNLGDSYAGGGGYWPDAPSNQPDAAKARHAPAAQTEGVRIKQSRSLHGLKPKDLMMVPARVAIALVDDGWYLRSDIIWAKRNCMPESCRDRPTSSHEHVFLLTKQPRYFYDAEAVREDAEYGRRSNCRGGGAYLNQESGQANGAKSGVSSTTSGSNPESGRNQRNVWHLATEPFPDAHFATFPSEIPRRCIKAGTSEKGACAACGAPWVRQKEPTPEYAERLAHANDRGDWYDRVTTIGKRPDGTKQGKQEGGIHAEYITTGWQPSCGCAAGVAPCVVLDPFLGSGTTLLVADQLGRDGIGIELNPAYAQMARDRIYNDAPLFVNVAAD